MNRPIQSGQTYQNVSKVLNILFYQQERGLPLAEPEAGPGSGQASPRWKNSPMSAWSRVNMGDLEIPPPLRFKQHCLNLKI